MRDIPPSRPARWLTILAGLAVLTGAPLRAQELSGTIRMPDGLTPAPGVLLVAVTPGTLIPVGRAVTGENGFFVLRVPLGNHRLRALRVGFHPTELGQISLAAGERRRADFMLTEAPVVLAAVTSRAAARCTVVGRTGGTVATLFDEARKALLSSQLAPPEGRPSARILLEQAVDELDGTSRVAPQREILSGFAARPFRSAPPAQLATTGYTRQDPDGTTFFAPDANVLLSDEFAATHCLRLASTDPVSADRVGIAFEPVGRSRGIVRIRGTLWLDRSTFGLQRLEFSYVGLPVGLDRTELGGFIDFAQVADGLWFEDRWEIRMPRVLITRRGRVDAIGGDASVDIARLDAIQRTGGRVLSIQRSDRVLYAAAGGEPELAARGDPETMRTQAMLLRAACARAASASTQPIGAAVGIVTEANATPSDGARVVASWQDGHRIDARDNIFWKEVAQTTVSEVDGFYALCSLPRDRRFLIRATKGARITPPMVLRLESDVEHARADLRFVHAP